MPRRRSVWMKVYFALLLALLMCSPLAAEQVDRDIAVWALHLGGAVLLEDGSSPIRDVTSLPGGDFRIVTLNLVGTNMHPPHMKRFAQLTALRKLHLPGPMWNPRAESRTDYNCELAHLGGLKTLKKLTVSHSFLRRISIKDAGVSELYGLGPNLEELVLRKTRITGATLGALKNLRSLDVTWSDFNDEGMGTVAYMRKLRKFWAQDTAITDEGLWALAHLTELEELDLGGNDISEAGLVHLSRLTNLKKLNILGHCCPVKSRIESIGWGHRGIRFGSRMAGVPVKWAFFRIA